MNPAASAVATTQGAEDDQVPYVNFAARAEAKHREKDARAAALWPVVEAVENRLVGGVTVARLRSESGITDQELSCLSERKNPLHDGQRFDWTITNMESAVAKLALWLEESGPAEHGMASVAPTPTCMELCNLIDSARTRQKLLVIVGGFGVGKTKAAQVSVAESPRGRDRPGIVSVAVSETDNTVQKLLRTMLFRLNMREPYTLQGDALPEVRKLLRPGDVVILDECQRLAGCEKGAGAEIIRQLFDETGASFVLLGNEKTNTRGNILDEKIYGALASRARVYPTQFLHLNDGDVDEYMSWRGVSGVTLRRELVRLFARRVHGATVHLPARIGGLRKMAQIFDDATGTE